MATYRGYIGTYTKADSEGIYTFELDTGKKELSTPKPAAKLGSPTYLNLAKDNKMLYAVINDGSQGGVAAYQIDEKTGDLHFINKQTAEGPSPCHVSVDNENRYVLSANYHSGTIISYPLHENRGLNAPASEVHHKGSGPHERQEKAHTHYSGFTPDENYAVAVDLGTDRIITYQLNEGKLEEVNSHAVAPGSGPRHIEFHPKEKFAYVMTELSNEVIVLEYNDGLGEFREIQVISALPEDFDGASQGGAIHVTRDGKFVYVSNRGHDSIAVFAVNEYSGELSLVEHVSTEGEWPRDFMLDPSERFLIAANQETGTLTLFERNESTGTLTLLQSEVPAPEAVCVKFLNH
ncbi:lactonase family protein [Bacillus sonorensis]|uniref:lactonase family protein n=1 Tax=Bacillus sonorensis TaxID=119858 RepID=UPI001F417B0C|nr:lactonase family protein [Bacillus sonorensis]MCF7616065.1 lactonase family protein [Bacillus sonorensis]MCY8561716.1 lactonase family protein [Bacillus sonorensis]